jgi:hypothetical protein
MQGDWKVKGFNGLLRRWTTIASGSEEFCRRVFAVQDYSPSFPSVKVKLVPPRTTKSSERGSAP